MSSSRFSGPRFRFKSNSTKILKSSFINQAVQRLESTPFCQICNRSSFFFTKWILNVFDKLRVIKQDGPKFHVTFSHFATKSPLMNNNFWPAQKKRFLPSNSWLKTKTRWWKTLEGNRSMIQIIGKVSMWWSKFQLSIS